MEAAALIGAYQQPAYQPVRQAGAQLPLSMVREGQTVRVLKVHGGSEQRQHLAELGFVEHAEVRVVSRSCGGLIVKVKGATLGLGLDMAKKVTTT